MEHEQTTAKTVSDHASESEMTPLKEKHNFITGCSGTPTCDSSKKCNELQYEITKKEQKLQKLEKKYRKEGESCVTDW